MKRLKTAAILFALTLFVTMFIGAAHAAYVTYVVAGSGPMQFPGPVTPPANAPWGPDGYPGDTVELQEYAGELDLTPGSYELKVNTLLWTIDYTYAGTETDPNAWSDLAFPIDGSRDISLDGHNGTLSQQGLLEVTWYNDFLSFALGSPTTFVIDRFRVDVTPLAVARTGGSDFGGGNPWGQPEMDMMARFDVSEIPEPSTLVLGWILLVLGGAYRLRSRRSSPKV